MIQVPFLLRLPCLCLLVLITKQGKKKITRAILTFGLVFLLGDKCPLVSEGVREFVVCLLKQNWFMKSSQIFMACSDVLGSVFIFIF